MLLFLYSAAIFFHSSTFGMFAFLRASPGFDRALSLAMSRISTKETGIKPGPPSLPMGLATNHSGLDCAITMIASPALASSSSARSAAKSYMTIPYTMALDLPADFELRWLSRVGPPADCTGC
jgi:hypothetical protein